MLSVKVWCMPHEEEAELVEIEKEAAGKLREIAAFKDEEDKAILILLPQDLKSHRPCKAILIEGEFQTPRMPMLGRIGGDVAEKLGRLFEERYAPLYVAVKVKDFNGNTIGYWPGQKW